MDISNRKVFIGGLLHSTTPQMLQNFFQKFGSIEESSVILDKNTGNSKGYGFVTFYDPACAAESVKDPSPVINGKIANCNISVKPFLNEPLRETKRSLPQSSTQSSGRGSSSKSSGNWGEKRSRTNNPPTCYLQRLRDGGQVINMQTAIEKIEKDRLTNPAEAFKYFLEVSELFRGNIEFGYYATLLLKQSQHYRKTGEVLVEDDASKLKAEEQSRVDMKNAEEEKNMGEADHTEHFQQFEQQEHDEDENQGQFQEQHQQDDNQQQQEQETEIKTEDL